MTWFKQEWIVFISSMIPFTEMRGSIPYGALVGFSALESTLISLAANLLLIPVLLLIYEPVFNYFKTLGHLRDWVFRVENRAQGKYHHFRGYRFFGLMLFVALPLPGTGIYTGCLAAVLMKMSFTKAWLSISIGAVLMATIIGFITAGVLG